TGSDGLLAPDGQAGSEPSAVPTPGDGALPTFRGLAARSALFGLGGVAQKVVGVLLIPLITRSLSTTAFGRLEVLSTLITTVTSIAVLGLDIVATRQWVDHDGPGRQRMFGSWLGLSILVGGGLALVGFAAAAPLSRLVFGTEDLAAGVRLAGLCAFVNLLSVVGLTALRNEARSGTYAVVAVATVVTNAVLSGVLAWRLKSVEGVLLGLTLATALGATMALLFARHLVCHRPSLTTARTLLVVTAPLVPGLLLTSGGDLASRFVLLGQAGATEVGFYSIAIRFTAVGLLVHTGFQLAWQPRAYAISARPGGRRRLGDDAASITVILAAVTVALACTSPELLRVLAGHRYDDALGAVGLGLLVPLATLAFTIATTPLVIANRLRAMGLAAAVAALVSLATTTLLAADHGAAGAMVALSVGQLTGAVLALRMTRGETSTLQFGAWRWCLLALTAAIVAVTVTVPGGGAGPLQRAVALTGYAGIVVALEPALVRSGLRRLVELRSPQRR
ncbi:MAG: oligosaccharide flippase family protein, partial [Acidimicrobiales bacterium]